MIENSIFVIGAYINNKKKEETLINLINGLKQFDIPILLSTHYPVSIEVQKMVNYSLFDANNPVLTKYDFAKHNLLFSKGWVETVDWKTEISMDSADYAIWTLMRNAVNFVKYLGKEIYYYIDYDNNPDMIQYLNEFIVPMKNYDAVILKNPDIPDFYMTFIYSLRTDLGIKIFNQIKTEEEYYRINHDPFYLETAFKHNIDSYANNIYFSEYKANGHDLGIHNQIEDTILTHILLCDDDGNLYINFSTSSDIIKFDILVRYDGNEQNYTLDKPYIVSNGTIIGGYRNEFIVNIGKYKIGEEVTIYYNDVSISTIKLNLPYETYKFYNNIEFKK